MNKNYIETNSSTCHDHNQAYRGVDTDQYQLSEFGRQNTRGVCTFSFKRREHRYWKERSIVKMTDVLRTRFNDRIPPKSSLRIAK